MDLHGEGTTARPASDALCNALQILNHLQDCKDDYRALDRVYIPRDFLRAEGIDVEALDAPRCSPALRAALNRVLDRTDELIVRARHGPAHIESRGLRLETAVIICIAERLSRALRRRDPLAGRVELGKLQNLSAALWGIWRGLAAR
jgi:phytoene/squalene synthetase